jgi:hypothetical protein
MGRIEPLDEDVNVALDARRGGYWVEVAARFSVGRENRMTRKCPAFLLLALATLYIMSSGARAVGPHIETERSAPLQQQIEKRQYIAEDGRNIVITALGNLIRFESPRGFEHVSGGLDAPIDGYVLAYRDLRTGTLRVLHNVYRSQSSTIEPGLGDFVPVSFQGPDSSTVFPREKLVRAVVVVGTRDGLVQVRTTYSWIRGMVRIDSLVTPVNRPIRLISFKRQSRYPVGAAGAYGVLEPKFDVLPVEAPPMAAESFLGPSVVFSTALCCRRGCGPPPLCPPRLPDFSEEAVNTHSILFQAGPDAAAPGALKPTYLTVAEAKDDCERLTSGQCQGGQLPRFAEDSLVTSGWLVNKTLAKKRSIRFLTRTTIF